MTALDLRALQAPLKAEPAAALSLTANRNGDAIDLKAEVSGLKKPGGELRLRLVLVEERVRYPGRNGQRLHHQVVRAFPGGVDGIAVRGDSATQQVSVNVAELRRSLTEYVAKLKLQEDDPPLELKRLKAVAFLQDDGTREVLHAVQTEVAEAP